MQLGIFAKTFDEIGAMPSLEAVAAAGFETAQFNLGCVGVPSMPDTIDPETAAGIGTAARTIKVPMAAASGPLITHGPAAVEAPSVSRFPKDVLSGRSRG